MHIVHRCFWNCFFIKEIKKKNMLTDCSITCICRVPGRFQPWGGVFSSRSVNNGEGVRLNPLCLSPRVKMGLMDVNKIMIQIFKKK